MIIMTNLKHMDSEKNFKLLISAVVRMHEVGIKLINFRIGKSDMEPITLSIVDDSLVIEDDKDEIRIRIPDGDLIEKIDDLICRIEKSPTHLYNELLCSHSISVPFEKYSSYLRVWVINKKGFITTIKDIPSEKRLELGEKYDKVIDFITVLREYPDMSEKIQKIKMSSLYGKNGGEPVDLFKNIKQVVKDKNLKLLISTIVKMQREGFVKLSFRFNVDPNSDKNLIIGLDKNSIIFNALVTTDSVSLITKNSDDKLVDDIFDMLTTGPLRKHYDDLINSRQMKVFLREFKEYLLTYINSTYRYRVSVPDVTEEKIANYNIAYSAVVNHINEYK